MKRFNFSVLPGHVPIVDMEVAGASVTMGDSVGCLVSVTSDIRYWGGWRTCKKNKYYYWGKQQVFFHFSISFPIKRIVIK